MSPPNRPPDDDPQRSRELFRRAVDEIGREPWRRKFDPRENRRQRHARQERQEASEAQYSEALERSAAQRERRRFLDHVERLEIDPARMERHKEDPPTPAPAARAPLEKQVRRGRIRSQAEIDLHGMRVEEAVEAVRRFTSEAQHESLQVVKVITGKGLHSECGESVVRGAVMDWLGGRGRSQVREFYHPPPKDGGRGAIYLFIKPSSGDDPD